MKLDYKKTIKVGIAFCIIILFWNVYDFVVPLLLDNVYGLPDDIRGLIMGLDNLLSLFLLPIFGKLSDNHKGRRGRRTPFILYGTLASVCLMIFVPLSAEPQLKQAVELREQIVVNETLLDTLYERALQGESRYCDIEYLNKNNVSREYFISLNHIQLATQGKGDNISYYKYIDDIEIPISKSEYDLIKISNADYAKYAEAGVRTYKSEQVYNDITKANPASITVYMIILLLALLAMATFRSPAVALMPDVTPKPLRSQANAIINLAGGAGGAIGLVIYYVWFLINDYAYTAIFITTAVAMLLLLILFLKSVNEKSMVKMCHNLCIEYNIVEEKTSTAIKDKKAGRAQRISLILILLSIFMWFMGYNAVTTNLSIYTTRNLLYPTSTATIINAVSMIFSAIAFIPVGILAVKYGRKKSIALGYLLAIIAYVLLYFIKVDTRNWFALLYLISGFGLIIANVNTFPMVVELSDENNVGKYTGYYYVATMSAQAITPYIAGKFMLVKAEYLFIYSAICVVIATVLIAIVKHGDSKAPPVKKLEMLGMDEAG